MRSASAPLIYQPTRSGLPDDRLVIERPPPGAARGMLSVPATAVVVVTALIVVAVLFHVIHRARRR